MADKQPVGLAAIAAASDEPTAEPGDDEGYVYRVTLHSGFTFEVVSKHDPVRLASIWQKARKADEVVGWNGDQFTEARQVAHLESVLDEDDEGEEKNEGVQTKAGESSARASAPVGLAAHVQDKQPASAGSPA